jgi:hypothetical protein
MIGFDNVRENLRTILTVSAVFFAILAIFKLNGWSLEEKNQPPKEVVQVLELEAFTNGGLNGGQNNNGVIDASIQKEVAGMGFDPAISFCSSYNGAELEQKCNALTRQGCAKVSCCGYLNGSKCVSGSKTGPTFLSDVGGEKIVVKSWK